MITKNVLASAECKNIYLLQILGHLNWYINRLKAMSFRELIWRIGQRKIQRQERKMFGSCHRDVGEVVRNPTYEELVFDKDVLGIYWGNTHFGTSIEIHLLKGPDYGKWPDTFSYDLDYKQRDDLGDARTNWEKNRHFDWALLAKAYYVCRDDAYYEQLNSKVTAWCERNPFLHGISWTSAMELAIRAINWMYALAFVQAAGEDIPALRVGVINMTEYLTQHYSRYSSANNHLLVEATAIGLAGYAFHYEPWQTLAKRILTEELPKQNYADGVNKELSLHYQTFGMEAYLLMAHVSGETRWNDMLKRQAEFVAHSTWRERTVCEFGDDDEGKILDLQGGEWHQWEWVLQLASLVTGRRYSRFDGVCENTCWLFKDEEIEAIKQQPMYDASASRCFKKGGNSFLRDKDDRVLIGIDHAALGFGSIAAHGHADALSFQMLVDGQPVITDPGTFIYHCDLPHRNSFRKTINHSTVCVGGRDQSEMLGAFLWGRRAACTLEHFSSDENVDILTASHDGYKPIRHQRTFEWYKNGLKLRVKDVMADKKGTATDWVSTLMMGKDVVVKDSGPDSVMLTAGKNEIRISVNTPIDRLCIENVEVSVEYGVKTASKAIRIYGRETICSIDVDIKLH